MKTTTLYKLLSHVQIGHLYEHIFCTQLGVAALREGIFEFIDYELEAKTFYKGFVRLSLSTYTKRGERLLSLIEAMSIDFSEDAISGGLLQILAEKEVDVHTYDESVVLLQLQRLNDQPWLSLGESKSVITPGKLTNKGLVFEDRASRHFGKLTQSMTIPKAFIRSRPHLLPLFSVIVDALRPSLQNEIARNSFCYSYEDEFKEKADLYEDINVYKIDKRQATQITDEIETTRRLLQVMVKNGFIDRLSDYLLNSSMQEPSAYPNDEVILNRLGVVVGPDYWHSTGTSENIREVLNHITISYALGRSTKSINVRDGLSNKI